ncbi:ABC transporter permease subunit [Rhodopseudomonas pseudopalustris]|uniref:Putative spermidine/putrescine transport system permease protein n=1 Tax=Rhodopseudomonas pseudopalustris TaxID=1513892 RepID=A0A1H8NCK7_9BRAD|nr:ABC transporter permease subunit [Rhodopseudomonas pseudopalustris]SEO27330.1 putative spermidine/putrescine transport system permease protein [Rhodopseudomonas pseudopalustris]
MNPARNPNGLSVLVGIQLMLPTAAFLALFFVWPTILIVSQSLLGEGGWLSQYTMFLSSAGYVRILLRTLVMAGLVSTLCLIIAYPYAYLMSQVRGNMLTVLMGVVLISFFTSVMVRSFAWIVVMQRNGIVDRLAQSLGFDSLVLRGSTLGVTIAMVQIMLPFMIFPLYSTMVGIDRRLNVASKSLGANGWTTFWRVYWPLSLPGVVSGWVIVFITSLGFYVIPGLVGSPQEQLLSQLIYTLINTVLNLPLASAASMLLLLMALAVVLPAMSRFDVAAGVTARAGQVNDTTDRRSAWLYVWAIVVGVALLLPSLVVIPLSFPGNASFAFPPTSWSTRWYERFFSSDEWFGALLASLQVAVITMVLAVVLSVSAALAIRRLPPSFRIVLRSFVMAPRIVPGIIIAIAIYGLFLSWGLTATTAGFVIAHTVLALPFSFIPIMTALEQFDTRLEQASASLGAGRTKTLFRVMLPLISPGLLTGGLFAFVISFDEVVVSLFISGTELRTLPVQMYRSVATDIDPTIAAASTMLLLLTMVLVIGSSMLSKKFQRAP